MSQYHENFVFLGIGRTRQYVRYTAPKKETILKYLLSRRVSWYFIERNLPSSRERRRGAGKELLPLPIL